MAAHQKGLELLYESTVELPETVVGDGGRLRQILMNLLANAIKFTAVGEVRLSVIGVQRQDDTVTAHFAISDTGIGIEEALTDRIFEAFVQADSSHTRRFGGTGLGLAICSRLAALMGGRVWVDSQVGKGSTFHLTATFQASAVAHQSAAPDKDAQTLRGLKVLIVDDNETNRRILMETLVRWEMKPLAVSSGQEALAVLRDRTGCGRFDLRS